MATDQPGTTNHGNATTYGWTASVVVVLSDVLPDCVTSADMTYAAEFDVQLRNVLEFFDRLQTKRGRAHAALEPEHSASTRRPWLNLTFCSASSHRPRLSRHSTAQSTAGSSPRRTRPLIATPLPSTYPWR